MINIVTQEKQCMATTEYIADIKGNMHPLIICTGNKKHMDIQNRFINSMQFTSFDIAKHVDVNRIFVLQKTFFF